MTTVDEIEERYGRGRYDDHIRADEVKAGDQLHLTVMGGDEYVTVSSAEQVAPGATCLSWTSWGGPVTDTLSNHEKVWVKKR